MVALLTDDAWFTMPPVTLEYQGRGGHRRLPAGHQYLAGSEAVPAGPDPGQRPARLRLLPAGGRRTPVFRAHGLIVLTLEGDRISAVTRFVDNSNMARFGLW